MKPFERLVFLMLSTYASGFIFAKCESLPKPSLLRLQVTACEEVDAEKAVRQAPRFRKWPKATQEKYRGLYRGVVISESKERYFVPTGTLKCDAFKGRSLSGTLHFNCCDGDPGLPCLLSDVEAYFKDFQILK